MTALIKQPAPARGLGYWPAFWALGSPMRTGGGWPASGEIDMMEDVNGLNEASQTLHDAAGSSGHPLAACGGSRCESGYHAYSVIINRTNTRAEYLRFLMDGRVTDTITEAEVGAAAWHKAIDHGFFIIFDLAMGGNYPDGECGCTAPVSATTPGAAMSVAYVAVYEKGGNSTPTAAPTATGEVTGVHWPGPAKATPAVITARGSGTAATSPSSGAPPASFWGNTRNIPVAKKVLEVEVINRTNGHFRNSGIYWSFDGTEKSIAQQPYIDMPANSSGRMYFYLGSKTSKYYDFIEFTVGSGFINVDTTRVDRFGLKLALLAHSHDGSTREIGESYGTFKESRAATFQRFKAFVPAQFKELATIDAPYGIPSPGNDPSFQPGGKYAAYFTKYAAGHGAKGVTTAQVFGCGGALSANPPLCAALDRHVAQLPVSAQSNPANFYKAAPANYYAAFWHRNAINGKQYGFPYDDDASQSSDISVSHPAYMVIAIGW